MKKFVFGISVVTLTGIATAIGGAVVGVSKVCKCSMKEACEKLKTAVLGEQEEGTTEEIKEEN